MDVYVIMCLGDILESEYYTDENIISKRVEALNEVTNSGDFWYKTLHKK